MAYKPLWDWMDKQEGRKKGSSTKAMKKEKDRQYPKDAVDKRIEKRAKKDLRAMNAPQLTMEGHKEQVRKEMAKKMKKDMSNKGLGSRFLKSKYSKDIPKERKEYYKRHWDDLQKYETN